jgi:two-component system sensor histidine kinase/response regulator
MALPLMDTLRIIIVEDNPADDKLLRYELRREFDYEAVTVDNEADFLRELSDFKADLILSDYLLPGFSGMKALQLRNEKDPLIPFILVTGSVNEEIAVESIKAGASDYVTKEHLKRLNVSVKNVLAQRQTLVEKQEAERDLYRSLERFRNFVENDISGDYFEDNERVIYCNNKILELFEFDSLEELNTFGSHNLYDNPKDLEKFMEILNDRGKVEDFEVRMHTRTGKKRVIVENAIGEFDENGNLQRIQGYLIDITQRVLAEEKLRQSENMFRTLTENTTAGIVIYDEEHFLYANPAILEMLGYTEEEMKKMHFWEVVYPYDRDLVKERGRKRIHKQEDIPRRYEFRLLTKSGEVKWIDFTAGYINFNGIDAGLGSAFDITAQKQAMDQVRLLSTVSEQSPLSVVITDLDAKIEFVNHSFTEITGYSPEEVLGQNPRILKSGKTPQKVYDALWTALLQGNTWRGEFINRKKSGVLYYEYAVITPIKDEEGNVVRYVGLKEDITQRKKLEKELKVAKEKAEEANRLKSAFLANISHELRTPLNGILGFSELIMEMEDVQSIQEMTRYINESGQRLLRTLDMIIAISRLDSDTYEIKNEGIDVIAEFRKVFEKKLPEAEKKNLRMVFFTEIDKLELLGDRNVIAGALEEIVDNAIKFTHKGVVSLKAGKRVIKRKTYAYFEIKDTGIGIAKKHQQTIFEDFRQASSGYGRKYEGNGLGLSLAKKYVELIGGFIELVSAEGSGSVFTVYLPLPFSAAKS